MAQMFNPPDVWSPFGAFSMGVVQGDGQVVYLKGQVALDQRGQIGWSSKHEGPGSKGS